MHHIIPHCKGGLGDRKNNSFRPGSTHENCIYVTKEEHYILHQILYEDNPDDYQLAKAFMCMSDYYNISAEEFGQVIYHCPDELRDKLSKGKMGELNPMFGKDPWNKGIPLSDDARRNLSEKLSGENNPNFGKHRKEETKDKISKNSRGTKPNNKPVICLETGQIYYSIEEAERQTGYYHIAHVCHGRRKSTHNTHWRFIEDGVNDKEKT